MDDVEHQLERGKKINDTRNQLVDAETCCCGKIGLWKGIMILSTLTMIFSIIFMAFDSFIRGFTPWWVWGGTITGVVEHLRTYFKVSSREILDYLKILDNKEIALYYLKWE